jgi:capsular polysaccharide biosynthesis protein
LAELESSDAALRIALPPRLNHGRGAVRVDGVSGLVWSGTTLLNPPFVDDPSYAEQLVRRSFVHAHASRAVEIPGSVYVLRHVWERNTYHLLWDLLPQLALVDQAGVTRVLVGSELGTDHRFRQLVIENLGFRRLDVVATDRVTRVHSPFFGHAGWPTREIASWIVERFAPSDAEPDRRIMILRDESDGRSVVNLDEIAPIAARHGFESFRPESHTFEEQIRTFAAARFVVGVHGAGLANVVFRGRRPLTVLELLPDSMRHPFYFNLVRCLGAEYRAMSARPIARAGTFRDDDVWVDPGTFDAALTAMVPSEAPS